VQQLVVAGRLRQFPSGRGDRDHHLNLAESCLRNLIICRKLAIRTLQLEKGKVAVAGYIGTEPPIDQRFVRPALHPDAGVVRAFDQDGLA
jgi:hypothetical protein